MSLKHIQLGTDCKEYFNYDGSPLPIRPLSTYETDQVYKLAAERVPSFIFKKIINTKLQLIKGDAELDLNKENYEAALKYWNEIDYWTVYFAMKDFQDEEFAKPDYEEQFNDYDDWSEEKPKGYYLVRKMNYVHQIAQDVETMSNSPDDKIVQVLENKDGKVLAQMVHRFHQPLASEAWKLTPLQSKFIYYSRPGAPEYVEDIKDIPGVSGGDFEDVTKQLAQMGFELKDG